MGGSWREKITYVVPIPMRKGVKMVRGSCEFVVEVWEPRGVPRALDGCVDADARTEP